MKVNTPATRIAKLEAICDKLRAEQTDVQKQALQKAIDAGDVELAAMIARTIRNKLLEQSDGQLALDRFGLELPSSITATTMLTAFKNLIEGLKKLVNGSWAEYRQALRDLPDQKDFPVNIVWPEAPETEGNVNE